MFRVKDLVRVKRGLVTLRYGWGSVAHGEVGKIKEVDPSGDIYVDFPQHVRFVITAQELEYFKQDTDESRAERSRVARELWAERAERIASKSSIPEEEFVAARKFLKDLRGSKFKTYGWQPLHYKGTGHAGHKPLNGAWHAGSSCFSPVCSDTCHCIIKATKKSQFTKRQQRFIGSLMKGVSGRVREFMRVHPIDWVENTAWFGSGKAYNNYFAFVLWRMLQNNPELVFFFQYLRKCGYTTAQSYYLLSRFRIALLAGGMNIIEGKISKGIVYRLSRCGMKKKGMPYTMSSYVVQPKGDTFYIKQQVLMPEYLTKSNLDKLLQEV